MLLLMGDGQLESGGKAIATTPVDELWGTGRLRMRMWTPEGLDVPYRFAFVKRVLSDGDTISVPLYPDAYGVNQDIPSAVDWFKAVVWWYEPNAHRLWLVRSRPRRRGRSRHWHPVATEIV